MSIRVFVIIALGVWTLAAPDQVLAATDEHAGWGWLETIGRWFNLAVLFGLIFYAVRQPAAAYFSNRRAAIQKEMRDALAARQEAEKKLAEAQSRMENLEGELRRLREQAAADAEQERQRIMEQTRQDAEKIMASARREIEGMGQTVRKDLKAYAARLSVELAEKKIKTTLDSRSDRRLVERFFDDLSSGAGSN